MTAQLTHATANRPGAIGILQLVGDTSAILPELTGIDDWPIGRARLVAFADIDHGLAVRLNSTTVQLMPHGGPRVVQRLTALATKLGAKVTEPDAIDPHSIYPEAQDDVEAMMLLALARAESPLAVDVLMRQPRLWRQLRAGHTSLNEEDRDRSNRLNRLISPPMVVLAGKPNVGKSTLSNALLGRAMSIALDMPGTTRDYVSARVDFGGIVIDWHDTPGLRHTQDEIEATAAALARQLMLDCDLLIAMRDPQHDWPELPRKPDLWVMNKSDLLPAEHRNESNVLLLSAANRWGLEELSSAVCEALVPASDRATARPWLFDSRLQASSGS